MARTEKRGFISQVTEVTWLLLVVFLIRTIGFGLYQVPTGSMETSMLVGERFFADKFSYSFLRKPARLEVIAFNEPPAFYPYSKNKIMRLYQDYVWGPSNWTKRVIGIPGDLVEGKIEDGKPVVYVNGTKLDEPYLNKYPLIHVYKEDPQAIQRKIQQEVRMLMQSGFTDQAGLERLILQREGEQCIPRSFDPDQSYSNQPFYRIDPKRVCRDEQGDMHLVYPGTPHYSKNPEKLQEGSNYWDGTDEFRVQLAPDEYWAMGDNRLGSKDCRVFGPIKANSIHGRILFRIWSIDSDESWWIIDLISHPIDFWKRVRWSRFFQIIH